MHLLKLLSVSIFFILILWIIKIRRHSRTFVHLHIIKISFQLGYMLNSFSSTSAILLIRHQKATHHWVLVEHRQCDTHKWELMDTLGITKRCHISRKLLNCPEPLLKTLVHVLNFNVKKVQGFNLTDQKEKSTPPQTVTGR